jgi:hypothetical protein
VSDTDQSTTPRRSRTGSMGIALYAVAFVCMLVAGAILAFATKEFFRTTTTLWASVVFSVAALVLAVVSLFVGRRR